MAPALKVQIDRLVSFAHRRRRLLGSLALAVGIYALLGFFLAPWLVKKTAIDLVRDTYAAELRIRNVAVNPFVFSLRVDGLEMDDPTGAAFARLQQLYVNFQLSSLFRWALTFAEIRLDGPELFVARDDSANLNTSFLTPASTAEPGPEQEGASMLRLIVQDFSVNAAAAHWRDAVPVEPVLTTFGPVDVQVLGLSTLPDREGQQQVVITTDTAATFSWSGSLQLNPLQTSGHASVRGSHFPLVSAYVRDASGFEAVRGNVNADLDYAVNSLDDGSLEVRIDDFTLALSNVLVRTYGVAGKDDSDGDRDVLEIPQLRIAGGTVRWPERTASIGSVTVDDGVLSLYRNEAGELNVVPAAADQEPAGDPAPEPDAAAALDWAVSLDRVEVNRMALGLVDDSVSPAAEIGVEDFNLAVSGINNTPGTSFPVSLAMRTPPGGIVTAQGAVSAVAQPVADLDLTAEGISLALLHPYIKPLADVSLDRGALGFKLHLHSGPDESLALTGDVAMTDFLITETEEGSTLGSWDSVAAKQIKLSLSGKSLEISEVRLDKPYADIFIAEDGSANLGRVAPGEQSAEPQTSDEAADATAAAAEPETEEQPLPLEVTIGRVVINDAAADFADRSLPLPFDAKIAALSGSMTTIATASSQPSEVTLEGKVDEYGLVQVSGKVTPLQPALNTDLKVRFQNTEMPKFSAYSVPFAGREIASGKLDLDLGYKVTASELAGENRIVLRDFELGDRVEHPGAMDLPLGLAVALLKSPDGTIDIDLLVRGNVDDPEFGYGRVVRKALANLIVKIVAAPFALLGRLVGVEANELEHINFLAGRADLTPPEQERIVKLADALVMRPQLMLELHGVIDREADGLALRTARLDALVDERIGQPDDGADATYVKLRTEALEDLFKESAIAEQPTAALAELRSRFTVAPVEGGGKADAKFDELAYAAELRRQLIDTLIVAEDDFVTLATTRADNIRAEVVAANAGLQDRITVGDLQETPTHAEQAVRMKVILTAQDSNDS